MAFRLERSIFRRWPKAAAVRRSRTDRSTPDGCSLGTIWTTADATFGFTEAKLGILPAIISPYVLRRIGEGHARALFLTAQRFDAERARAIGLVHEVVPDEPALDARVGELVAELLSSGPTAVRAAKTLIRARREMPDHAFAAHALDTAAGQRVSDEGQEGLGAFLEKRPASWRG